MKKSIFVAGFVLCVMVASAQVAQKKQPPKPPPPPPTEKMKKLPPPPPPPPGALPAPSEPPLPPVPPISEDAAGQHEEYEAFLQRNTSVKSLEWNWRNDVTNELVVRLKSGAEERYQLDNEDSRKAAEDKYGQLPTAPPPPPPPPVPEPPVKKRKRSVHS